MTVPLGHLVPKPVSHRAKHLELVVEVVEYNHALVLVSNPFNLEQASRIGIHDLAHHEEHLGYVLDRSVLIDVPALLRDRVEELFLVIDVDVMLVSSRMSNVWHRHGDLATQTFQLSLLKISLDLGELRPGAVDDMRPCELRLVLVEAVRKKYREIVHPHIARCSREQDPVVLFGNLEEGLHPCSIPDETLFVK